MAQAKVEFSFRVTCPHCGKSETLDPIMTGEGDELKERFRQIVFQKGGETNIPIQCNNPVCRKDFTVDSFLV
jgi:hypothetical protein